MNELIDKIIKHPGENRDDLYALVIEMEHQTYNQRLISLQFSDINREWHDLILKVIEDNNMEDQKLKKDAGKIRMDLVPPSWFVKDAEILTFGIEKGYEADSWRQCDIERYKASTLRHLFAYLNGEKFDPESNKEHLSHVRVNIGFLMELDKENK